MKCKYCNQVTKRMSELKAHFASKHVKEYAKFNKDMQAWDSLHEHEMGKDCPICPHRRVTTNVSGD